MENLPSEPSSGPSAEAIVFTQGPLPKRLITPQDKAEFAEALEGAYHGITLPNEEDVIVGKVGCQRCEVVPQPLTGAGVLQLRMPHTHSLGKVLHFLSATNREYREEDGTVSIPVPENGLAPLLSPLTNLLATTEQRDTRALFQHDERPEQAAQNFEIDSLPHFVARLRSGWLLKILRDRSLHTVFQPIMRCPKASATNASKTEANASTADILSGFDVAGYECLMRGEANGVPVAPGLMLDIARSADLLFQLDLAARRAAISNAAAQDIQEQIFVNFTPNAIYNPSSCLDSTVRLIDELGLAREQIVFEIIESERLPDTEHLKRIAAYYRDKGFCFALDDVGSGFSSMALLVALRPDYVKIDMSLTRNVHNEPEKAIVTRNLLETAQELNLKTVAEGIETPDELAWVQAHGADFVQGYLFARPAAEPPLRDRAVVSAASRSAAMAGDSA